MHLPAKLLSVLSAALSAAAVPHLVRGSRGHHDIAARVAIPEPIPVVVPVIEQNRKAVVPNRSRRRRDLTGRCIPRSSSLEASSSSVPVETPSSTPEDTPTPTPEDTTTSTPEDTPTFTPEETPTPTPTPSPTPTPDPSPEPSPTTTNDPPPATTSSSGGGGGGGGLILGSQTGAGTFYATGLGACGIVNNDSDYIAAVSHLLFDSFPGYDGANPNNNPLCGLQVTAHYQGRSVTVALVDRCEGCEYGDLDFSPSAFAQLASFDAGRIFGMTWSI